jgi:hypothetical protein
VNIDRQIGRPISEKVANVVDLLITHRDKTWGVVELAQAGGIAPSYAVKIIQTNIEQGWMTHVKQGYKLVQPRAMLDRWAAGSRFGHGQRQWHFVVPGDSREVEGRFIETANRLRAAYALTLFSGARRLAQFVRFPASHAYLEGDPMIVAREIRGRPISEGGNLILVEPKDPGVFRTVQVIDNARVVSTARLYVDLFNFAARGREQAEYLLETVMPDLRDTEAPAVQAAFSDALGFRDAGDAAMKQRRWADAMELLEKTVKTLTPIPTETAKREARRAQLLWWMSLVHLAFDRKDRKALEKARQLMITESQVEELRRHVGYNATHVGLALQAYFAALALLTDDPMERRTYAEKARIHHKIITSPYAESRDEVVEESNRIASEVPQEKA